MKRLLLLPLIVLASCAPLLSAPQGTSGSLTFTNGDPMLALNVVLATDGAALTAPRCTPAREGITVCTLGDVPANTAVILAYNGTLIDASATWRTPNGKLRAIVLSR